jgi:prephenate dehydratase
MSTKRSANKPAAAGPSVLWCLGPAGTSSYDGALELFPKATIKLSANFDALFEMLRRTNGVGFVPIENSLHGSIDEVLDLLIATGVKIWRTYDVAIHYAFGAVDPKKISQVASHPQALAHCRQFLRKHYPLIEYFPVNSTAYAIELALKHSTIGAIGRVTTMRQRGLPVLHTEIQGKGNTTRFAIVATKNPFPNIKPRRMSIVLRPTGDRPGLLHDLLTPFKVYDVNLTRIESRPAGTRLGEYVFFVDLEGNASDARTKKVFEELRRFAEITVLGEW